MSQQLLSKKIEDYLLSIIEQNKHIPNYILPSENQLALKLNVSRVSVRKALSVLEERGLIYKIRGKGTLIKQSMTTLLSQEITPRLFGLIVPDFSTSFPRRIFRGIKKYCSENSIKLINVCSMGVSTEEEKSIHLIRDLGCNGVIILPTDKDNYNNGILELAMGKFPTVLVDRTLFGLNLSCVMSDHYDIGYKAAKYLLKKHTDVCIITLTTMVTAISERIQGFEAAVKEQGKSAHKHRLTLQDYNDEEVLSIMENFFAERPQITGIICNSGHLTSLLMKTMKRLNKQIQKDFELVLIDTNSREIEYLLDIKIPTIEQDPFQIGYAAAEVLAKQLTENEAVVTKKIPLLCDLSNWE